MPTITMTVRGGEQLRRNLDRLAGAQRRQAQQDGLEAGIGVLETHVKLNLSRHGSGVVYRRRNKVHQASAPGEPPAPDEGHLRDSVQPGKATPIEATLDVFAEYGEHLEFGTSRMAPRPFLRPALDEHEGEIVQAVEATVAAFVESIRA